LRVRAHLLPVQAAPYQFLVMFIQGLKALFEAACVCHRLLEQSWLQEGA
jgi:hypothetical protein